jgi:hypothetical protein
VRQDGTAKSVQMLTSDLYAARDPAFYGPCSKGHRLWKSFRRSNPKELVPDGYGLMTVDFDHRWIGHAQNYTHPFTMFSSMLTDEYPIDKHPRLRSSRKHQFYTPIAEFQRLWAKTSEDARAYILSKDLADGAWGWATILLSPPQGWTQEHFQEDTHGWLAFARAIRTRGWQLSPAETHGWDEYLSDHGVELDLSAALCADDSLIRLEKDTPKSASSSSKLPRI